MTCTAKKFASARNVFTSEHVYIQTINFLNPVCSEMITENKYVPSFFFFSLIGFFGILMAQVYSSFTFLHTLNKEIQTMFTKVFSFRFFDKSKNVWDNISYTVITQFLLSPIAGHKIVKVWTVNPYSQWVGHIGPTLFWRKFTKKNIKCSVSRWRPQKVDKCMVLEHTHGLFIT
jgi:hypothetical protein